MRSPVYIAVLVLLGAATGWLLYNTLEAYEKEIDRGYQQEAITNPFLAAERYLKRLGKHVDSFDSFKDVTSFEQYDTLFLSDTRHILSEKRLAQVLNWLNDGGHLIVIVQSTNTNSGLFDDGPMHIVPESNDKLLTHLGFFVYRESQMYSPEDDNQEGAECEKDECAQESSFAQQLEDLNSELAQESDRRKVRDDLTPAEKVESIEGEINDDELTLIPGFEGEGPIKAYFPSSLRIWHPTLDEGYEKFEDEYQPFFWRGDIYGAHIIQMEVGHGLVSMLSSASVFESDNIELFDHAYLWDMLNGNAEDVAIFYATRVPSFWQLTLKNAPELLFTAFMLLLLWVARHSKRFGPVTHTENTVRRSLAEHIHASGNYLWRHKHSGEMVGKAQNYVHQLATGSIDGYSTADLSMKIQLLAAHTGMPLNQVVDCMTPGETSSQNRFMEKIQRLQKIGNSL